MSKVNAKATPTGNPGSSTVDSHDHDDDHGHDHAHVHEQHPAIVKRLKRATGHLRSVVDMLEDGRPCLSVAQQLHAVEKAISQAKRTLIQDHLDQCLEETVGILPRDQRRPIDEFKEIVKYL